MIKELLKKLEALDTGPVIIIDDLATVEELLEEIRFEFNNKEVGVPEPGDLPDENEGLILGLSFDEAKEKYTVAELKQLTRDYNETVDKSDRLKLGGKEDDLIKRLLDAGVKL